MSIHDPNDATTSLISLIKKCIDLTYFGSKNVKNKSKFIPRSKWITKAILISCSKEILYQIWKINPDNNETKTEYKNYVNIL